MNQPLKDRPDWYTQEALNEAARIITVKAAELQVLDQKPDVVRIFLDIISQLNHEAVASTERLRKTDLGTNQRASVRQPRVAKS